MKNKVVSAVASVAIISSACAGTASASTYTVQKGDTLTHIAKKYQTSVVDLKKFNSLNSDLIRVNQVLQVDDQVVQASAAPAPSATVYTIVKGDTLSGIARKYSISLRDLMQWNNLSGYLIYPGKQLKVSSGEVSAPAPVSTPAPAATPAADQPDSGSYIVKDGDTLGSIALQFGCTADDLKQLNNLTSDNITAGQTLKVNQQAAVVTAPVAAAPVVAPQPTVTNYVVKGGDTLRRIATQFDTTVNSIKQLNGLTSDLIFIGQALKITGDAVTTTAAPHSSSLASMVIAEAKKVMGVPYVWGGSSLSGFDCSGFIYYVFNKAGYSTSRYNAEGFYNRSHYVEQPQPGDLVFFENTYKKGVSHVGIYLGDHQFIHADENRGIAITSLNSSYFKAHFDGFKRLY
jgi:LysM repeat protein